MITPQDLNRLSAYIDNQLSPAEKTKLESRLGHETELQQALTDLRLTRRMLRSLPTIKPPRNFTLTRAQAQAAARPRFQLFPALRLATALAGFAFVFLLAVDLLALQNSAGETAAPALEQALKSTEPTETVETSAAGGVGAETLTEAPPPASPLNAETPTPAPELSIAAADLSATPTPDPNASRSVLVSTPTETPLVLAYNLTTTEEATAYFAEGDDEAASPTPSWPTVRYLEIALGLLTVLLAVAAWWWRNR